MGMMTELVTNSSKQCFNRHLSSIIHSNTHILRVSVFLYLLAHSLSIPPSLQEQIASESRGDGETMV